MGGAPLLSPTLPVRKLEASSTWELPGVRRCPFLVAQPQERGLRRVWVSTAGLKVSVQKLAKVSLASPANPTSKVSFY